MSGRRCSALPPLGGVVATLVGIVFTACGPSPTGLARTVERRVQDRAFDGLQRHIDARYADPLGDRSELFADLKALERSFPRWTVDWTSAGLRVTADALLAEVEARLEAELVGMPVWKVEGPMRLSLHRTDRWRVQGGLLTDLRDIRGLMQARRVALEANDVEAMAALLHPAYADGLIDKVEAVERLRRDLDGAAIRLEVTNYRLEVRRDLAHIDEFYSLVIDGRRGRPARAGLTLRKSAGRWKIAAGLYRSE